jgi:hypothetical protein
MLVVISVTYLLVFIYYLFFLWLYSRILGLGRLHKTFRFISVYRSRTVGSTPWTGDQLVARPLLSAPGECDDDGEVGGMNDFGRGTRSTRRKPAQTLLCSHKSHLPDPGRTRAAAVGSQRLAALATALPTYILSSIH